MQVCTPTALLTPQLPRGGRCTLGAETFTMTLRFCLSWSCLLANAAYTVSPFVHQEVSVTHAWRVCDVTGILQQICNPDASKVYSCCAALCCAVLCSALLCCVVLYCVLLCTTTYALRPAGAKLHEHVVHIDKCSFGSLCTTQLHWDVEAVPTVITDRLLPRLVALGVISAASDVHQAVLNIYHKVITSAQMHMAATCQVKTTSAVPYS